MPAPPDLPALPRWAAALWDRTWSWPALSGVLLGLAFPTDPAGPLAFAFASGWAWIALVPLLWVLDRASRDSPSRRACASYAFRRGWVTGTLFTLITMYWVADTQGGGVAVIGGTGLMAAYLGLYTGAFAAGQALVCRALGPVGALAAPVLWTAVEYVVSLGELGFPWLLLGHSQAANAALIQYAAYTGAYGVSFVVVLFSALSYLALAAPWPARRRLGAAGAALAALALPGLWGWTLLAGSGRSAGGPKVGLVQNNLGLEKWQPGGYRRAVTSLERLSRRAASAGAGLLVWPETAMPCRLATDAYCRDRVQALVDELGVPVFTGAPRRDAATGQSYNASFLVPAAPPAPPGSPPAALQTYSKMHLVPFGERTPFRDRIPLLRDIDWAALTGDLGPAEFAPGQRRTLFEYGDGLGTTRHFGALICFESVFPDLVRRNVLGPETSTGEGPAADFLVIITNDSWFGATAGPYQHAAIAALRAVENRTAIARCATSGISLFIDPFGRSRDHTALYEEAVRVSVLTPRAELTPYTRYGDVFARATLIAAVALLAWSLTRHSRATAHA